MASKTTPIIQWGKRDKSFIVVIAMIVGVNTWLLLTPFAPKVAGQTMLRFQLQTKSFAAWMCQFPIPAMYNFANQYKIDNYPSGLIAPLFDESEPRYLNHFPARCFTFADGRGKHLFEGKNKRFTIESSYRGQTLKSKFHLSPDPSNETSRRKKRYRLIRSSVQKGST